MITTRVRQGGQNYPLRGGKCSAWEGGLRGVSFIHAPAFLGKVSGSTATGLFHAIDWFPTILSLVTGAGTGTDIGVAAATGTPTAPTGTLIVTGTGTDTDIGVAMANGTPTAPTGTLVDASTDTVAGTATATGAEARKPQLPLDGVDQAPMLRAAHSTTSQPYALRDTVLLECDPHVQRSG
jgi:hypothetical protein